MFARLKSGFILLGTLLDSDCVLSFVCHLEVVQGEERIHRNVPAVIPLLPVVISGHVSSWGIWLELPL